jgi:hypothetical protein
MQLVQYSAAQQDDWDEFVFNSKNGIFFFRRKFMDYHQDRFEDHSLIFQNDMGKWLAVLPACHLDDFLVSHGGLTFGGVLSDRSMTTPRMLEIFGSFQTYAKSKGFKGVRYKAIPHMYHFNPAEEDLYALTQNKYSLRKREVTSVVDMQNRLPLSKGRKSSISKAKKRGIEVRETDQFAEFMKIEAQILLDKYNTKPTHSTDEICLLANLFPENIRLFAAFHDGLMCAGTIIFEHERVAHAQYMATTPIGRECGALDLVISTLLNDTYKDIPFFDFGISTENAGRFLNEGLIAQKEMFGARAMVHDTYEILFE